jgi:hypothetical protein
MREFAISRVFIVDHGWRCTMNCRPHGRKPTLALWMLVALADAALLVTAAGALTVLLVVAGVVTVTGAVLALRLLQRRETPVRSRSPAAGRSRRAGPDEASGRAAPRQVVLRHGR